ncbi:hypothetical protein ACFPRL_31835 [Pseudoclavibacter helvolus]
MSRSGLLTASCIARPERSRWVPSVFADRRNIATSASNFARSSALTRLSRSASAWSIHSSIAASPSIPNSCA